VAGPTVASLGDQALALQIAERLRGDETLDPQVYEVIASAYAANDRFSDAASYQEGAIKKAQKLNWNTTTMNQRLMDYRAGRRPNSNLFLEPR